MGKLVILLIMIGAAWRGQGGSVAHRIIFDTDMVEDYDDVGALAALHALADEGRCEILATVSCTRGNQSIATVEVINAFYGRKCIPVGCAKGIGVEGTTKGRADMSKHSKYMRLAKDYARYVRHANSDDAPDANKIYRQVLSVAPDNGVTVCSVDDLIARQPKSAWGN